MTLMSRSPPAALQKPFRYAAWGALPALLSLSYSRTVLNRCCGRPERGQPRAAAWAAGAAACAARRALLASVNMLLLADRTSAPSENTRGGWATGALVSHMSTVDKLGWYCDRTADVAASPHASASPASNSHHRPITYTPGGRLWSSLCRVACRQGVQVRAVRAATRTRS